MRAFKINITKLVILIGLIALVGCNPSPFRVNPKLNPNIEVIVSTEEDGGGEISPNGEKLVYGTHTPPGVFLLYTRTQQKYRLDDKGYCFSQWLDNNLFLCRVDGNPTSIVATDDNFSVIGLQKIDEQKTNLAGLLDNKVIYRLEEKPAFIALAKDYKQQPNESYYITVKDADVALQGRTSITLPVRGPLIQLHEKLYSHNQEFYFTLDTSHSVSIHKTATDEKLSEFSERDPNGIIFVGWAADNSGAYFMVMPGGMYNDSRSSLYKLKVP